MSVKPADDKIIIGKKLLQRHNAAPTGFPSTSMPSERQALSKKTYVIASGSIAELPS